MAMNQARRLTLTGILMWVLGVPVPAQVGTQTKAARVKRTPGTPQLRERELLIYQIDNRHPNRRGAVWQALLRHAQVVDYDFATMPMDVSRPEGADMLSKIGPDLLREGGWTLMGRDGTPLASGSECPEPGELVSAFQRAGLRPRIAVLRQFVQEHPGLVSARIELIHLLAVRAQRMGPSSAQESPADAGLDQQRYGELSVQLRQLFLHSDWTPKAWKVYGLLFQIQDPQKSEALRAAFSACLPSLREACIRGLGRDRGEVMKVYLHTCRMLGRTPDVMGVMSSYPIGHPLLWGEDIPSQIPGLLVRTAEDSGKWSQILPLLRSIWEESFVPGLRRMTPAGGTAESRARAIAVQRSQAWKDYALPLLKAQIRSGREGEAMAVLDALDSSWSHVAPYESAAGLATTLGRPDLAAKYRSASQRPFAPAPPGIIQGRPTLYFEAEGAQYHYATQASTRLGEEGIFLVLSRPDEEWKKFLDWDGRQKVWSLLGIDGRELAYGTSWTSSEELYRALRQAGLPPARAAYDAYLRQYPDDPRALAELAQLVLFQFTRLQGRPPERTEPLFDEWVRTIDRLLRTDQGVDLALQRSFPWSLRSLGKERLAQAASLFHRVLTRAENMLRDHPDDDPVWNTWLALRETLGRPLDLTFMRLKGHRAAGLSAMPGDLAMRDLVRTCTERKDWAATCNLLLPWLEEELPATGFDPTFDPSREAWQRFATFLPSLTDAMVRTNRTTELEQFLIRCKTAGLGGLPLEAQITRAKNEGISSLHSALAALAE